MKKTLLAVISLLAALALSLTGCAKPADQNDPTTDPSGSSKPADGNAKIKACMVSDEGGFDDKSFNETSYNGLTRAQKELGVEIASIESQNASDFDVNIQAMVDQGCDIIVTVGFMLGDATVAAGKANPNVKFAIVDESLAGKDKTDNVKPLIFNTAQPSFLAGYTAAGMSKTGIVGTFGGLQIPTVTIFMDGFAQGVEQYNKDNGTSVRVEGWDPAKQDGRFVGNFSDTSLGKTISQDLVSKGVDVIFPVAGPVGLSALQVAKESDGKVMAVWVDTDGYVSAPEYKDVILTSAAKHMDVAVFEAIKAAADGSFSGDLYVGDLANDGVSLAPFHDFDSKVSAELKDQLKKLADGIKDGSVKITSEAQPK